MGMVSLLQHTDVGLTQNTGTDSLLLPLKSLDSHIPSVSAEVCALSQALYVFCEVSAWFGFGFMFLDLFPSCQRSL